MGSLVEDLREMGGRLRLEAAAAIESESRDAERYRKLRAMAIKNGKLEAIVALGQFDFLVSETAFDAAVDAIGA
jgi:hypothetical protein